MKSKELLFRFLFFLNLVSFQTWILKLGLFNATYLLYVIAWKYAKNLFLHRQSTLCHQIALLEKNLF